MKARRALRLEATPDALIVPSRGGAYMRSLIIIALLLGPSANRALAEAAPAFSMASSAPVQGRETVSARESAFKAAVADCERMWDRGTRMTKQEWSRTCRRVQDRLEQLQVR